MEENIFIDPYMFFVKDVADIEIQINFFHRIISLCNDNKIRICLYQGLYEEIQKRELYSFPICINEISDAKLKQEILILNNSFKKTMVNHFIPVDIEQCVGEQEFEILDEDKRLSEWNDNIRYYELFCIMLIPCYCKEREIADRILTCKYSQAISIDTILTLRCKCESKEFEKKYKFIDINAVESVEDRMFRKISDYVIAHSNLMCESPETIRGDHHNKIQNGEIDSYEDIARKNKRVLAMLRKFGLYRIIFTEFHEDASKPESDIVVIKVNEGNDSDIMEGWLYCYTGFKYKVELYFPKGLGTLLCTYCEKYLSYKKVEHLISRLGL